MTIMRRTIHPVGCAQFITESFFHGSIHVVMDCGMGRGKNPTTRLEQLVDNYFAYNAHIDHLFVSHFDNDHYNGIQYLISKKLIDNNTTIYIPLLSYPMIYIMDTLEGLSYRKIINSFARVSPRITFVRPIDGQGDRERTLEDLDIRQGNVNFINSFEAIQIPFRGTLIWEYRPFYIQDNDFLKQFLDECAKAPNPIDEGRLRRFQDLSEVETKKLKDIYSTLKGNYYSDGPTIINMNAMLLISREVPAIRSFYSEILTTPYTLCPYLPFRQRVLMRPSCLYTSDAGLSSQKSMNYVLDAVTSYLPEGIGLLQIPHHGSYKCYNSDFYRKMNFEATFINGDLTSSNPAICVDAINDAYRYAIPLYLADKVRNIVQNIVY